MVIPGDANGDWIVNVGDLGILGGNYGQFGKQWITADFNGDGAVNVGDLGILGAHYGEYLTDFLGVPDSAASPVPEPVTFTLLAFGAALAMARRRKCF